MLNKFFVLSVILGACLGCGALDQAKRAATEPDSNTTKIDVNSNKSLTDKAIDTAVGETKLGIVECDEALDVLAKQADNPDDNFVTKAVKKTALNTFRDQIKQRLEQGNADRKEIAKYCKEFRDNLSDPADANTNSNSAH